MTDTLIQRIKDLTARFGKGWHDGIQIDASDIADLCLAADALEKQAAWQAALSAPPGYVLVPVEPTPEMVAAYLAENDAYWIERDELVPPPGKWRTGTPAEATARSYSAMIAAAPKEPT